MKIRGFFDSKFDAPWTVGTIIKKELDISDSVRFLIDTGASRTVISDSDAERLKIDYEKLTKLKEWMVGVGGTVDTYSVKNVKIVFISENSYHTEKLNEILVLKHKVLTEQIKRIPSLLGRDFLNKYSLILDRKKNKVVISD